MTKEVGVISLYFYSELLKGDQEYVDPNAATIGGTRPGKSIAHKVFKVTVRTGPTPVEIWRIYYRYKEQSDAVANREHLVPITAAVRQREQYFRDLLSKFKWSDFRQTPLNPR